MSRSICLHLIDIPGDSVTSHQHIQWNNEVGGVGNPQIHVTTRALLLFITSSSASCGGGGDFVVALQSVCIW